MRSLTVRDGVKAISFIFLKKSFLASAAPSRVVGGYGYLAVVEALLVETPFYLTLAVDSLLQLEIGFLERGVKLRVPLRVEIMHLDSLDEFN